MQAKLKYIPIEQLVHYAGKKVILGRQLCHSGGPGLRDDIRSSFASCLMSDHCTERMNRLASSNNGPYPGHHTWEGPVGPNVCTGKEEIVRCAGHGGHPGRRDCGGPHALHQAQAGRHRVLLPRRHPRRRRVSCATCPLPDLSLPWDSRVEDGAALARRAAAFLLGTEAMRRTEAQSMALCSH